MCGIVGISGNNIEFYKKNSSIKAMVETLKKRGPDQADDFYDQNIILGHARLNIIDLSSGNQPMSDATGRSTIVFNGEIYNYQEIKNELLKKNYRFNTTSDTEAIINLYHDKGVKCLNDLDGMFSFGLWDKKDQSLFLARDRFGKKPLYYAYDKSGNLLFASEIKALLASDNIQIELDLKVLDNYLSLLYIPPTTTIFKNIYTLPAGHYAIFKDKKLTIKKYWELQKNEINISFDEAKDKLADLLNKAVKKRLVADVEVGTFLSGGIDSSIISLLAQNFSNQQIKSFSAGFQNHINELPFAKKTAQAINSDHYELQIKEDLVKKFIEVTKYFDQPFADSSNIPTHLISAFAAQKVKVALSGDGADELFLGYNQYRLKKNLHWKKFLQKETYQNHWQKYLNKVSYFSIDDRKKIWQNQEPINTNYINYSSLNNLKPIEKINSFDINLYLKGDILPKVDSSSMMASLEVRSPFLDYQLAEFVYSLPENFKSNKNEGKVILREIFKDKLPSDVLTRKKQGFGSPIADWLRQSEFKQLVTDLLGNKNSDIFQFFNYSAVEEKINRFYAGDKKLAYQVWILLTLEIWLNNYKKYLHV